jgi:DNA-binding NarL/FixJ family response regulator
VTITVAIADDQALVRGGFRVLVDADPNMRVVGEAADGEQAVAVIERERPDVVLMDVRMPVLDGLEATRRITTNPLTSNTKVLVLTTFDLDEYVYAALRAGASGFLLKDTVEPTERPEPELLRQLSPREREVLGEVAGGWSNGEIGTRLHISAATAKTHVSRLLMKLEAHDRAQLVMIAYETGFVTPADNKQTKAPRT